MHVRVAIIGTGFSGIGAAVRLLDEGIDDFVMIERDSGLGGTWRVNRYPGCACDIPSRLYSFSFAQNPSWSQGYSEAPEILAYLERVADERGLRRHMRFDEQLERAGWDAQGQRWQLETSRGALSADILIAATGPLSEPSEPRLPGIGTFTGHAFHSARWDTEHDLRDRRVAVIGTGASAIQFVPEIQPLVRSLSLFQRTPAWIVPRYNRRYGRRERELFRAVPTLMSLVRGTMYGVRELQFLSFRHRALAAAMQRMSERHLEAQVSDPTLRAALTPGYTFGCKRILVSNEFYPAVSRPNVRVVTSGIREVRGHEIVALDGSAHEIDTIIFATGFKATDPPLARVVHGRHGDSLHEAWSPNMRAHASTTVHGFPNLFVIPGPNSGLGHTSLIYMIESQIAHAIGVIRMMRDRGIAAVEPTAAAQERYVRRIDREMPRTVWAFGGCSSWYQDATGHNSTLWPDFSFRFRQAVATVRPDDYAAVSPDRSGR
ncbi:MAG: NAD(P)/FAD-dependent oxidoreductase [Gemmatimonadota bacterium]